MIYDPQYVKDLLQKQVKGAASPSETATLLLALEVYTEEEVWELLAEMDEANDQEHHTQRDFSPPPVDEFRKRLQQKIAADAVMRRRRRRITITVYSVFFAWMAAMVIFMLLLVKKNPCNCSPSQLLATGISTTPYTLGIRLATDSVLTIDSTRKGLVARDGPFLLTVPEPGVLAYQYAPGAQKQWEGAPLYHTIATAGGSQYRLRLPDGTAVRLNAASAIRVPLTFSDTARHLELKGEALFDVAAHGRSPFVVQLAASEVRGTTGRFNIRAYTPSAVTTLLSGHLQITTPRYHLSLSAGEQALLQSMPGVAEAGPLLRRTADTAEAVSWKVAQRYYTNVPLREFVADMARWYNLHVESIACVPDRRISARICFNAPPEELFTILRSNGLRFIARGNTLTICNTPPPRAVAILRSRQKQVP